MGGSRPARRGAVALLAALGAASGGVATLPAAAGAAGPAAVAGRHAANAHVRLRDAHGIKVRAVRRIGRRQLEATIVPAALRREVGVRIILPVHYRQHPARRYPTLYLYPGTSGHPYDWSRSGGAPHATRHRRLVTISSDIGFDGDGGGWFTNWVDKHTALGPSQWERYDIHQLIPWVDANLATIRHRDGRAVAGLSQGGYGAAELAARHPDQFTQFGSFSGAPEINRDPDVRAGAYLIIGGTMMGLNGVEADAPFGSPVSDQVNWQGHDPAQLIGNLRHVGIWLATADGAPGKYDDPVTNPTGVGSAGAIESLTHFSTDAFIQHLVAQHVPHVVYDYGSGTHSWPYWARDLRKFLPVLMHRFAHPPHRPATVHYTSIDPRWSQYGWTVAVHRGQRLEFSRLSHAGRHGFRLRADGRAATVSTPPRYRPGSSYRVSVGGHARRVRTEQDGRLKVRMRLAAQRRTWRVRIRPAG